MARADTLRYTLRPDPRAGKLEVELSWDTQGRTVSSISVSPRWGTVRDVPALLKDIAFTGVDAAKREGRRWELRHTRGATIGCRYVVDPGVRELSWDNTHAPVTTRTFFHGIGNTFLLVPDPMRGGSDEAEVILRWDLPERWKAACSWGVGGHVGMPLKFTDLRHSVYLAGRIVTERVERDGREVTVALLPRFEFTKEQFAEMASKIVAQQCAFMRDDAFPPFVVTAVPVGDPLREGESRLSGSGLYRSFALFVAPEAQLNDAVEHLFAHELFHHWNGRLLAGKDPEELVYWFTEGLTDYYALRILYESGYWDRELFAKWINRHIREYYFNPAIDAGNEQIQRDFWRKRDTVGEVAYQRGLLLGLRWHRVARDRGVPDGLDRLFRALVERARRDGFQLTNDAVRQAGLDLLGDWFAADFDAFVTNARTIELPADAFSPDFIGRLAKVYAFDLGFDRERSLQEHRVHGLKPDSAAAKTGLQEGDELMGWSINSDPDTKTELSVLRGDKLRKFRYYPRGDSRQVVQYRLTKQ